jgi:dienelactone hydrolase
MAAVPDLRYTIRITPREDLGTRREAVLRLFRRSERERRSASSRWAATPAGVRAKRRELLDRVAYRPAPVPFRARLLREARHPLFTQRFYRLQINPDDETEAVLYLPRGASRRRPAPALLGLHEHGGQYLLGKDKLCAAPPLARAFRAYQRNCYGGQPPADFFAARGFAVFSIDQFGFGSRAPWHLEERAFAGKARARLGAARELRIRLDMRYEHTWLHRALLACGVNEAEISLHDNRRSLDFLETVPEVDASRVGAFGLSMGAMHCHQVAAFDPRVRASARVCWSGDLLPMLERDGPRGLGVHFMLPGINAECHVPELVALSHPAPVLILNGRRDALYPYAAQEACRREVRRLCRLQGAPSRVKWHEFDGPHCFHPPEQEVALEFFRRHL